MIGAENINFSYNGERVLAEVNFEIDRGEFVGIIGPNGAGKSTLMKLLDRIHVPKSGKILLQNRDLRTYTRKDLAKIIGFVSQEFPSYFDFTAREIVLMGRFAHQKVFGFETENDWQIVKEAMNATDCYSLRHRNFQSLSGGEKQRIILASALAQEPEILLLDEPTTALDLKHQLHFYEILKKLQSEKRMTILTVTHDINLAGQFCDRLLVFKHGRIVADGNVDSVMQKELLESVYETSVELVLHPSSRLPVVLPGRG